VTSAEAPPPRERIFNVPAIVLALAALLTLIHLAIAFLLPARETNQLILLFAFSPLRYADLVPAWLPSWWGPQLWTFVTHAFLHVNLNHLVFNVVWLIAFGSPVARRFGALRFLIFFAVTAAAGALVYLIARWGAVALMIGASGAVSGAMGAAVRFIFQRGGPHGMIGASDEAHLPAAPISVMLRDPRVLIFLAVWFGVNFLFGVGVIPMPGMEGPIAWEAHVGGFLAGLLGFGLFDPRRPPVAEQSLPISSDDEPISRQ
jgi:membrane associated rhomboid family serine protease